MRYRDGIISTAVAVMMGLVTLTGVAFSDQYPQAAQAERVGFEALAHQMFGGVASDERATAGSVQQ